MKRSFEEKMVFGPNISTRADQALDLAILSREAFSVSSK